MLFFLDKVPSHGRDSRPKIYKGRSESRMREIASEASGPLPLGFTFSPCRNAKTRKAARSRRPPMAIIMFSITLVSVMIVSDS